MEVLHGEHILNRNGNWNTSNEDSNKNPSTINDMQVGHDWSDGINGYGLNTTACTKIYSNGLMEHWDMCDVDIKPACEYKGKYTFQFLNLKTVT